MFDLLRAEATDEDEDTRSVDVQERAQLSRADINDLPDEAFAYIQPGGEKDETGRTVPRSLRHFPMHDADHVRNALARIGQGAEFGDQAIPALRKAAQKYGIGERTEQEYGELRRGDGLCVRGYEFEARSSSDGRTLEGRVAVFRSVARISDRNGDFDEEIHPGIFDRWLRSRGRPVMQFDHGKDPRVGTVPIGAYEVFEPDHDGYYVRGRLFDNPVVEPVRQAIAGGAIKGMSWRMQVPKNGDRWTRRSGGIDKRDVLDADVPEAGPVVFPAYSNTSVTVRSILSTFNEEERTELIRELVAQAGLAADLTSFTGRPGARSAGGGDDGNQTPEVRAEPTQHHSSPNTLRLQEQALRALGVLPNA